MVGPPSTRSADRRAHIVTIASLTTRTRYTPWRISAVSHRRSSEPFVDSPRRSRRPATRPIVFRESQLWIMRAVLVVEPDEPGGCTVYRMADVVHPPTVAVSPRLRDPRRATIIAEERPAQFVASLLLNHNPRRVLENEETERIGDGASPRRRSRWQVARVLSQELVRLPL